MLYWLLYHESSWLRQAAPVPKSVPRLPVHHVPHGVRQPDGAVLCIVLGPWLIGKLREFQIGQHIREEGRKSHQKKAGTPTMGGVLIIISIVVPRCSGRTCATRTSGSRCSALVGFGAIGFSTTTPRSGRRGTWG